MPLICEKSEKKEAHPLTEGNFNVFPGWTGKWGDWSPDGKEIVFSHTESQDLDDFYYANISKVEISTGNIVALSNRKTCESSPFCSPDGKWVSYLSSSIPPEIYSSNHIYLISSHGGEPVRLGDTYHSMVYNTGWSKDSEYIYFKESVKTKSAILAMPVDGSSPVDVINDDLIINRININESHSTAGFICENFNEPQEVYITDLDDIDRVKITSINSKLCEYSYSKTEIIRWKSTDGLEIEGLLTYPVNFHKGRKYPLVLIIHGGPPGVFGRNRTL